MSTNYSAPHHVVRYLSLISYYNSISCIEAPHFYRVLINSLQKDKGSTQVECDWDSVWIFLFSLRQKDLRSFLVVCDHFTDSLCEIVNIFPLS